MQSFFHHLVLILSVEIQALLDSFNLVVGSFRAALIAAGTLEGWILHFRIELNLRLGTRRTDRDFRSVFAEPLEHVGSVGHVKFGDITLSILSLQGLVVFPKHNL